MTYKLGFTNPDFQIFSEDDRKDSTLAVHLGITESSLPNVATFTAQSIPELNGLDLVEIHSAKLAQGNTITSNSEQLDIFAVIPVDVSFGINQVYHSGLTGELDTSIFYGSDRNLQHIDLRLTDERGKPVHLMGSFTLILKMFF